MQPAPPEAVNGRRHILVVGLAAGASQALGDAREYRADGGRVGGPSSLHQAWLPVRGDVAVGSNGAAPRPGVDTSSPRTAQEATQQFPTPSPRMTSFPSRLQWIEQFVASRQLRRCFPDLSILVTSPFPFSVSSLGRFLKNLAARVWTRWWRLT